MTILLIDNDRNQHEIFRELVRRINPIHTCLKAFSTETALERLLEADCILPDLIFLDLNFRNIEGKQMLKTLKASAELQGIPVCIYTDSTQASDRELTHELGAIGYIVKESNLTHLAESIGSVIASHQSSQLTDH